MESLTVSSSIDLGALGLSLGMGDYLLVGLSILLSLFAGLALCLLIGTFARDYKNAQTLIFPVTILAMVPMFLVMFKDFGTLSLLLQVILFIIPFSHPMMAMRALMFDNYALVIGGIAYLAVFSIAITLVLTRIFSSDRLLVGWSWPKRGAKA
jgi:ABC-2 type transport system permease protein